MGNALFVAGLYLDSGLLQLIYLKMPFEINKLSLGRKLISDANNKDLIANMRVEPPDNLLCTKC